MTPLPPSPVLTTLRSMFNTDTVDAREAWNIISALRGPDNSASKGIVKYATTSVIRWKALGLEANNKNLFPENDYGQPLTYNYHGMTVAPDCEEFVAVRKSLHAYDGRYITDEHFMQHVRWAFFELRLEWDKVNL
jgi:hypothetical protein